MSSKPATVEELRKNIWSAFYHASSTDGRPQHQDCPAGRTSWCFWQRAMANNSTPPSHTGRSSSFISEHVAKHVRDIYERLTTDALLSRCMMGLTQNPNESLHSCIWARCPKHIFVGKERIAIAVALAISEFNQGSKGLPAFMHSIGCSYSSSSQVKAARRDKRRISSSERKSSLEAKRRRTQMAVASSRAQQEKELQEGGPSYSSGAF